MNTWAMSVKWGEVVGSMFDPQVLTGSAFGKKRQAILSALHGEHVPLSRSGVTRLVDDLVTAYGVNRNQCYAAMLSDLKLHIQREVMQAQRNSEVA